MNNPTNHKGVIHPLYPQTVEIPQPLDVHPSVSALATELLLKTAELLAHTPACYNQQRPQSTCGSPCCIIGHMEALSGKGICWAAEIGLTKTQWDRLFYFTRWPNYEDLAFGKNYSASNIPAGEAIARIEHMLSTGE